MSLKNLALINTNQSYSQLFEDLNLKDLTKLISLELRNNDITYIRDSKDFPPNLKYLDLRNNEKFEFSEELEELDVPCIVVGEEHTCRNAATIKKILCANQNTAACHPPDYTIQTVLILFLILTLMFISAVIYFKRYYFYAHPFWYKICHFFTRITEPKSNGTVLELKNEHDAFILCHQTKNCECGIEDQNSKDNEIHFEIYKRLTTGSLGRTFKIASKENYLTGILESINLQEFVQSSKRIIVLLSKHFLDSEYHINEFKQVASFKMDR